MAQKSISTKGNLGKIYKLYNENLPDLYIGSTSRKLKLRLNEHKSCIKTRNVKSCFLEDLENLKIELLEEINYTDLKDLLYRERYWFEKLRPNLNGCFPIRTKKEYRNTYYRMNRDKILAQRSEVKVCEICNRNYTQRHHARHKKSMFCVSKQKELSSAKITSITEDITKEPSSMVVV